MAKDELGIVRQYDFSQGPNYTNSMYSLSDKELAQSENMFWEGQLKTIPGSTRLVSSTIAGTTANITGIGYYLQQDGDDYVVVATSAGRIAYEDSAAWTVIAGGLSTAPNTYWDWITFNNTFIMLSGSNPVKKWGGPGATFANLGGSPPQSKYGSHHAVDYLFFAGHTSNPSEVRYSDTATHETWPVGNSLVIGRTDNEIITGLQRFGDATVVFKTSSVWLVSGASPNDFDINPTPSDVGCIAPNSIVLTDGGIFFWSEAGPAIFNGFKTTLLGKRLRSVLDEVDWTSPLKINASYYPFRKQVLVSYARTGQTYADRMLLIDLYRGTEERQPVPYLIWPITVSGSSSQVTARDSFGIRRPFLGHSSGHVSQFDYPSATTFNGSNITSRFRTGALHLGKPDRVQLVRDLTFRMTARTGRVSVRYAMDGEETFTTHTGTPYSTANAGSTVHQKMLEGDGAGRYMTGNILQLDVTSTGSTGFDLYGFEVGSETTSRREPV